MGRCVRAHLRKVRRKVLLGIVFILKIDRWTHPMKKGPDQAICREIQAFQKLTDSIQKMIFDDVAKFRS